MVVTTVTAGQKQDFEEVAKRTGLTPTRNEPLFLALEYAGSNLDYAESVPKRRPASLLP